MEKITVGTYIKKQRLERRLSLGHFAIHGISKARMSQIENDKRFPKPDTLMRIARILKINVIELYKVSGFLDDNTIMDYVADKKV